MNILVCLKPATPASAIRYATDSGLPYAPDTLRLAETEAAALQFALDLRATHGSVVTVVSAGSARVDPWLQHGLDHGADRALRIDDAASGGLQDTARTARLIAASLREETFDLVLCASRSADSGSGYFPYALAAAADLRVVTRVIDIVVDAGEVIAQRKLERGWRERHRLPLPLLLAVEEDLCAPRHLALFSARHREGMRRVVELRQPDSSVASGDFASPALSLPQARRRPPPTQRAATSARDRLRRKPAATATATAPPVPAGDTATLAADLLAKIRRWLDRGTDESSA